MRKERTTEEWFARGERIDEPLLDASCLICSDCVWERIILQSGAMLKTRAHWRGIILDFAD